MLNVSALRVNVVVNGESGSNNPTGRAGLPASSRTTAKFILACVMQLLTIIVMLYRALIH